VGRFIVVGGEAAGASHRRWRSGQRHEHEHEKHRRDVENDLAHRQREPWNAKRPRCGPDDDRALFAGSTPPQVGTDKAYDVREFVDDLRDPNVTPQIAQNTSNRTSAPTNLATMNSPSPSPTAVHHAP
jgi:hypothetical protein